MNQNEKLIETFKAAITRLEADIAKHREYLNAAPSLEHHHYVVMIRPSDDSFIKDWTVRLTHYGPELQKRTTADNFYVFTSEAEARAAVRKIRLCDAAGNFVSSHTEVLSCRDWHAHMISWETETITEFNQLVECAQTQEVA